MKSSNNLPVSTATNLIFTHLLTSSHRSTPFSRYLITSSNQNSFFFSCIARGWNGNIAATNDAIRLFFACSFNAYKESMFLSNFYNNSTSRLLRVRLQRSSRTLKSIQFVSQLRRKRNLYKKTSLNFVSTFIHRPFLSLEKTFLKSSLPLSTPYRNLFSGVFDWDGKGFQELSVNSKLLDLHHKVVRRKVFLSVLHKLTRKVRVIAKTSSYEFNYKNYSLFKEGGLVTNRYMKINPRQTSFLNNRSLRDQGWGTFLPCKVQILSTFFKTYRRLVTYDSRARVRRARFGSNPLFVAGAGKILTRFDHFFKKIPQSCLNTAHTFAYSLRTHANTNLPLQEAYLTKLSSLPSNRLQLSTNPRGFQRTLSFNQLRFRSSRQNRPQLKLSTKAVWATTRRHRSFTNLKSTGLGAHLGSSLPTINKGSKGATNFKKSLPRPTLKRLFSNKNVANRWMSTCSPESGSHKRSRSYAYKLLSTYTGYIINLRCLHQGSKRQILNKPANTPKRRSSRRSRRFTRSIQYKLKGLTGSRLDKGYLSLVRSLVLRTPMFSRLFRTFFWQQSTKAKRRLPLNRMVSHPSTHYPSLMCSQPAHFLNKSSLNLLIRRWLRHFRLISTYTRLENFNEKRRLLINVRADRARKYKRSRRKRRVSALSVLEAEGYLTDVRKVNALSNETHLNALSTLTMTILHLSRSATPLKTTWSKVTRYAFYNSRPTQSTWVGRTQSRWIKHLARTRRIRRSRTKESLVPTQLPFSRKIFLNELANRINPTVKPSLVTFDSLISVQGYPASLCEGFFAKEQFRTHATSTPKPSFGLDWSGLLASTRSHLRAGSLGGNLFSNFLSQTPVESPLTSRSFKFVRPEIVSHYELPFIFSTVGFLFLSTNSTQATIESHYDRSIARARINKHRLSFFIKNDIKRVYLKRPGLLKLLSSFMEDDSLTNVDLFFNNQWRLSQGNLREPNTRLASQFFNSSIEPGRYLNQYATALGDGNLAQPISVKRIRFKPGYQRIWRRAREAINFTLNFNCRYQIGLTKRLMWLRRLKRTNALRLQEVTLQKTLLNAHFVFDLSSSLSLVQSNTVYVNGLNSKNPNLKLFVGDFIQLIVSLRYYIVYRWLVNWNNYHNLRFRKLLNFKNNSSRSDLSKQVSRHLPDWIFTIGYKSLDIPKYLEVDYFTLSAFYIYEPLTLSDYHPLTHLDARPEIYTMYNWKYIT